jgi:hypothetical protein
MFAKKSKWATPHTQMTHVFCLPSITEHLAFVSEAVSLGKMTKSEGFICVMVVT